MAPVAGWTWGILQSPKGKDVESTQNCCKTKNQFFCMFYMNGISTLNGISNFLWTSPFWVSLRVHMILHCSKLVQQACLPHCNWQWFTHLQIHKHAMLWAHISFHPYITLSPIMCDLSDKFRQKPLQGFPASCLQALFHVLDIFVSLKAHGHIPLHVMDVAYLSGPEHAHKTL